MAVPSGRLSRRLSRHHLPLALAVFVSGAALYATRPYADVVTRLSFASAYPALILLILTLVIGPFKLLTRDRLTLSLDLRRDIGIWAGITGLFHVAVGQFEHLRGRPWLYYIYDDWQEEHALPIRYDLFGLANYAGLFAGVILLVLLATSHDVALRRLGAARWKRLQRWSYLGFALTAFHTFSYQKGIGNQQTVFVALAALGVVAVLIAQWLGWRRMGEPTLGVRRP